MKIEDYEGLINKFAARAAKRFGVEFEDAKQEAYLNLLNAFKHFDERSGVKFSTYLYVCLNNMKIKDGSHKKFQYCTESDLPENVLDSVGYESRNHDTILFCDAVAELDDDCAAVIEFIVYDYDESRHGRLTKKKVKEFCKRFCEKSYKKIYSTVSKWWNENCSDLRGIHLYA